MGLQDSNLQEILGSERAAKAKGTRIEIGAGTEIFQKHYKSAPEWEELKTMLVEVLNGAEPTIDKMFY